MSSFLTSLLAFPASRLPPPSFPSFPYLPSPIVMASCSYRWLTGLLTLQAALASPWGYPPPPKLEEGKLGAVASESEICSHIGIDLLKQGGNAADALVGTVACVGVVGMYHSGMFLDSILLYDVGPKWNSNLGSLYGKTYMASSVFCKRCHSYIHMVIESMQKAFC